MTTSTYSERSRDAIPHIGHQHFWQRAMARRQFLRTTAGMTALAVGAGLWSPAAASDDSHKHGAVAPNPIPLGLQLGNLVGHPSDQLFHIYFPVFGNEVSTITDFNGYVAAAEVQGVGTGTNTDDGTTSRLTFDADMRFMQGLYVGVDGKPHHGTFGFV